jgi:hypothetical protein
MASFRMSEKVSVGKREGRIVFEVAEIWTGEKRYCSRAMRLLGDARTTYTTDDLTCQ